MYVTKKTQNSGSARLRLSVVVHRTHRLLFTFILGVFIAIGFGYLFWVNHMGMQGIFLSELTQEKIKLIDEKGQIEAKIAGYSSTKFLAETDMAESLPQRKNIQYFVKKAIFTAERQGENTGRSF